MSWVLCRLGSEKLRCCTSRKLATALANRVHCVIFL